MAYDENGDWIDEEELPPEEELTEQEKRRLELLGYQAEPAPQPLQAYAQAPLPLPAAKASRRPTEAELSNKAIPVGERFNNPFNMWHDKYAATHGGDDPRMMVTPQDRPASFPSKLDGAAAAIQKMAESPLYRGKTMTDLIGTWVGHGDSYAPIIEKATGISRHTPITREFLESEQGLSFLKTMARYETKWEQPYPLSDEEWRAARDKALGSQPGQKRWIDQVQSTANQLNNARGANEVRNQADLYTYLAKDKDLSHIDNLSPALHNRLAALIAAAPPEIRNKISINSGYRSYERQAELFKAAVIKYGSEAAARKNVAPPGKSQHNFGNAADLGFSKDPRVVKWVHENAPAFGLRFRMAHEKWHIEPNDARGVSAGTIHVDDQGDFGTVDPNSVASLKSGVSHTEPEPELEQTPTPLTPELVNATNPSVFSTILNHQFMNPPPELTPLPQVTKPPEPTFMEKLSTLTQNLYPIKFGDEGVSSPMLNTAKDIKQFTSDFGQGLVSGVQDLPTSMLGSPLVAAGGAIGELSGSDTLKREALQGASDLDTWKREAQARVGMNPNNLSRGQYWGHEAGSNLGISAAKTAFNLALGKIAEKVIAPSADYMAQNYPLPNINPISTAEAADPSDKVFGKPPLVVMTPAGPQAMNDADVQQLAWGGILMIGFGSFIPTAAKTVKVFRSFKPAGLDGVFDPRRQVTGAPGTEAASLPVDRGKAMIVDPLKAAMDAAERQARYTKGTDVGIDPVAANEVLQHWRVQTNSGAQALIGTALKNGEMNVGDFRFHVAESIGRISEWASRPINQHFAEYLRLRVIQDEIQNGLTANALPRRRGPGGHFAARQPVQFPDGRNNFMWTQATVAAELANLEHTNPNYVHAYRFYQENLEATRNFVSSHQTNAIQDPRALTDAAIQRPGMPIFAATKNTRRLFDRYLAGKDHPLKIAEQEMTRAFEAQMRFDGEQRYIEMTHQNSGRNRAFTERLPSWATGNQGARARQEGAVLTRRHNGELRYWTADPMLVSIMESGYIPLSTWDQFFANGKSVFQKATTGFFAPWFAMTGGIRAMEQGWTTAPAGIRTASGKRVLPSGPIASAIGVAKRIGPQMSRPTAKFFRETVANTTWGRTLTLGQADLIARSFEKWYMDSYYRRMEVAGAFPHNPVMEGNEVTQSVVNARRTYGHDPLMNPVINWMERGIHAFKHLTWDIPKKVLYTPGNALLTAIQEAPAYEMARKTLKGSDATHRPTIGIDPRGVVDQLLLRNRNRIRHRELTDAEVVSMIYKNYTGDPSVRGYFVDKHKKSIRFDEGAGPSLGPANDALRATWGPQNKAITLAGAAVHGGRFITPWSGVLIQSPAATLAAMRDNPVRANMAFAASAVMPEVVAYLWNSYWSNVPVMVRDENGNPVLDTQGRPKFIKYDFVNHSVNGRNSHQVFNNVYFAVPNRPPWEGIEFRHFQETAFQRYMTRMFMHQYAGKAYGTIGEDVRRGLNGFFGTAIMPPLPPVLGAFLATKDLISTGGFLGTAFKSRYNQYMDLGGGESTTELIFRAVIPAITDIWSQAMQAGTSAPDWWSGVKAAGSQVGHRMLSRTAIIGDLTRDAGSTAGSTILADELWDNRKIIDDLSRRLRYDESEGISTKRGSNAGRREAENYLGELPPSIRPNMISHPGLPQKEPTNPLYKLLIEEVVTTFNKDEPQKGGIGFKAMWGHYGIWGQLFNEMRPINHGNDGPWIAKQLTKPEDLQWFRERNVNPLDQDAVRNFYQYKRNQVSQKILQTIKATEQRLSQRPDVMQLTKGKPFKLRMLDPHELGLDTSDKKDEDRGE